eukprot:c17468_g1_i1 orf=165-2180(+)
MSEQLEKSLSDKAPDAPAFEVAVVYTKPANDEKENKLASIFKDEPECAVERFATELRSKGLLLEHVEGRSSEHFFKIAAPVEVLGHMAETLQIRKPTHIGLDVPFEWDKKHAFVQQAGDNNLFSWTERHKCLHSLLYGVVNSTGQDVAFRIPGETKKLTWQPGESLLSKLMAAKVIKDVLILHEDKKRKELLHNWAFKWGDFTSQPVDSIYLYFGPKVAIYFTFLGMYTQWLFYPSIIGIFFYYTDLGSWESIVPPLFSMLAVTWAVLFLQFWKRKNAAVLARWNQGFTFDEFGTDLSSSSNDAIARAKSLTTGVTKAEKQVYQKEEWAEHFRSFRNNAAVIGGILCLQLPFEIFYAHISYIIKSKILNFLVTGIYLLVIQYFTTLGGKFAARLTKSEQYANKEAEADSLIYKVFGVYFMQTYIGLLYHALFQRDFTMLRQFLIQRLVISQIINNITENLIPYISYRRNKHNTLQMDKDAKKDREEKSKLHMPQIEKEYLKPSYTASIDNDLEDGLFDDFLELALQFGMVAMFASAFPLVFAFALINNLIEIRSDALKLLLMLRRPVPRAAYSIGAWLNIFQFLGVIAICTNCALLVCLYDQQGKWTVEPGLAAVLLMEHVLLLVKFGFSCFVPEEPAWVRAKKVNSRVIREHLSKRLLHNLDVNTERQVE